MVLKLSGSAARNVAAAIYTIWKNRDKTKTKGYQRLDAMLKSGKELKVFTITEKHLKQFSAEAKRYGVVYCALRGKERSEDGMVDIMVRAEDASKINRIVERFKLATVDAASIKQDITQERNEPPTPEPELAAEEQLLDELLGVSRQEKPENPTQAKTEKSPLSEPTSGMLRNAAGGIAEKPQDRPSVRETLREIAASRQKKVEEKLPEQAKEPKAPAPKPHQHKQPKPQKKRKQKVR